MPVEITGRTKVVYCIDFTWFIGIKNSQLAPGFTRTDGILAPEFCACYPQDRCVGDGGLRSFSTPSCVESPVFGIPKNLIPKHEASSPAPLLVLSQLSSLWTVASMSFPPRRFPNLVSEQMSFCLDPGRVILMIRLSFPDTRFHFAMNDWPGWVILRRVRILLLCECLFLLDHSYLIKPSFP